MTQLNIIRENVAAQILKVESLLNDATNKKPRSAFMLACKAQTTITCIESMFYGTGLLNKDIRCKLDKLYAQAHQIANGVYTVA